MEFDKLPGRYPGARQSEIIVGIAGCDPDMITEARIFSGGRTLGIKRFRGEARYDVNVGCYLADLTEVEPPRQIIKSGFAQYPAAMKTFSVEACQYDTLEDEPPAAWEWIKTGQLCFTTGGQELGVMRPLTEITEHELGRGETMEIRFISDLGTMRGAIAVTGPDFKTTLNVLNDSTDADRMYSYMVCTDAIEQRTGVVLDVGYDLQMTVSSYDDIDGYLFSVPIRIVERPRDAVRMCWENPLGGLDYHTFSAVQTSSLNVEKNRFATGSQTRVGAVGSEVYSSVYCPLADGERLGAVAGIISSPRVWVVRQDEVIPVDILTDKVVINHDGPDNFIVSYRETLK